MKPQDSAEALAAFRSLWAAANADGRRQSEEEVADLKASIEAIMAESQPLEGDVAAANIRAKEYENLVASLTAELSKAAEQVTLARAAAEQHALRVAESLERIEKLQSDHAAELSHLRKQLDDAQAKAHEFEIKFARAEARLDLVSPTATPVPDQAQPLERRSAATRKV